MKPAAPPIGVSTSPVRRIRLVAIVSSLVGILCALALPFLPVDQQQSSLSWPQNGSLTSVDAPLVSYAPLELDVAVPCSAVEQLAQQGGGVLVSTSPATAPDAAKYGMVAQVTPASEAGPGRVDITQRDRTLLSAPLDGGDCSVAVTSTMSSTTASVGDRTVTHDGDIRPQMVGVYTQLEGAAPDGMSVTAQLDSRFSSSPSAVKVVAMVAAVLATAIALVSLHRIDNLDGRRSRRFLPARWWRFDALDGVVLGTLVLWHFIGATTSDDGYQFTMARASEASGYMANYFRWFGVPEAPFGSPYYDVLAIMASVTTASPWVRLPALLAGIVAWLVISREVAPRLGAAVRGNKVALWTGGLVFLAFWLPYNNGLRPEPIVAVGALLTWCSVERAIATRRLLPAAVAILVGALTVSVGPSGLICFGALVAGARPIMQIVIRRARTVGYLAVLGPLLATGLVILVAVFADQGLAAVLEMQRVHAIGPDMPWFEEYQRYQWLFNNTGADGGLARRFGVFVMILSLVVTLLVMLRKGGRIPGTSTGPSRRIVGITLAAMLLMMFTPTKWTHHFGIYAGLAGSLAVLTSIAVGTVALRSRRNRALFAAAVLFVLALCFTGPNSWWYVSSYSIPWWNTPVSVAGIGASTVLLGLAVVMLGVAAWYYFREPFESRNPAPADRRPNKAWSIPPLTVAAAFMVVFMVLSFAKGAVSQYPAFSLTTSNVGAVGGNTCGLADSVLVETDPNASMLEPLSGNRAAALAATATGFTPNGVAGDLSADEKATSEGMANSVDSDQEQTGNTAGTGGGSGAVGVNGSTVALPFGLDPATTPVLGSFGSDAPSSLTSEWYALPRDGGDLISIGAAGRIHSISGDGVVTDGGTVVVEYGKRQGGQVTPLGTAAPVDIGPAPSWRNLRIPLDQISPDADTIRVVAQDDDPDPDRWLAVTPPRVPQTETLNQLVGSDTPTMIDWLVGLQFPCQRPFDHTAGVAEIPEYRILPDRPAAVITSLWQDHHGGGPLGWIQMSAATRTIPTYMKNDWDRDWGSLEQYTRLDQNAERADVDTTDVQRSGTWSPGPINTSY
ncbi:arabinosyltransferase domain-containing protein [Rhodococcus sp. HNM0569]|uniref:arabinosyltransferase domain-containing protein n=1 Tax=Rhodococcus sp. HNM0569 TaxID=2716340 RepID=UPI003211D2B6